MSTPPGRRTQYYSRPDAPQLPLELKDPGQPTLGEVASWFLAHFVDEGTEMSLSTKRGYRSTLRQAVKHFGEASVPTVGEAREWLRRRKDSGEITGLTANSHRNRMHYVYTVYRDQQRGITLNPFTFKRFKAETRGLKGQFEELGKLWPKLLAALPDDRARAFVSLVFRRGLRPSEPLGLEWRHVQWKAVGGPAVRIEQQRRTWEDVPGELKHDGEVGTFGLHPETAELLRKAQRALREGKPMLGCARGSLVGTRPCKDSQPGSPVFRQFVFPYREEHLTEILRCMRAAAPTEFPSGQAFYRFRRHFGVTVALKAGPDGVMKAKKWLRHKHLSSTQAYLATVLGVQASREELAELDEAMDSTLSASHEQADTVEVQKGSQTEKMAGG